MYIPTMKAIAIFVFYFLIVVHSELKCSFDVTPFDVGDVVKPVTVQRLDLSAYSGRWYLMYASMIPNMTHMHLGMCVTSDYSFIRSTPQALYVRHTMTVNSPRAPFTSVRALALHRTSVESQQGLFQMVTGDDEVYTKSNAAHDFNTCIGNYRVVALGDVDKVTGKYSWSVVSTPFLSSVYILARNVQNFREIYAATVLQEVDDMGFTTELNKPRETYQSSDCQYIPEVIVD